jgi:TrmH family RNA methyltransferase
VKALLGSRGKKIRNTEHVFIADGLQSMRSALNPQTAFAPRIHKIYVTASGIEKLTSEFPSEILKHDVIFVSDQVMNAMTETQAPQGMLAVCKYLPHTLESLKSAKRIAYFWQLQDPGNAGTAIRTADACGFDAVVFSELSVDIYSPKVVRSTAGSLWNIPVVEGISLETISSFGVEGGSREIYALDGSGEKELTQLGTLESTTLIFGNEARGLPNPEELPSNVKTLRIAMRGHAESFNVASAAAIAMFHVSR